MVEKLDRLSVERKIVCVFVVEKVDCVRVQLQTERLQKENVIAHNVLVGKVELVNDDGVDVIVAQKIICRIFDWFSTMKHGG